MKKEFLTSARIKGVKNATILSAYLIIFWGFYRFLVKLPDEIEELIVKPLFWLSPTFYFVFREKLGVSSIGITLKRLFPTIYLSLGLGVLFVLEALVINYLKYRSFNFGANIGQNTLFISLGLSLATAISEEITFRGYLFTRFWSALKREWLANILTTAIWILIHVPITVFVWKLDFGATTVYLFLTALFGFVSGFLFARTKNIVSSIFLHVLWEWPIILFR